MKVDSAELACVLEERQVQSSPGAEEDSRKKKEYCLKFQEYIHTDQNPSTSLLPISSVTPSPSFYLSNLMEKFM